MQTLAGVLFVALIAATSLVASPAAAQTLAAFRKDVRDGDPSEQNFDRGRSSNDDDDESYLDATLNEMFGKMALVVFTSPYWVPAKLLGDEFNSMGQFQDYPHCDDVGCLSFAEEPSTWDALLYRTRLELGTDLGDTSLAGVQFLVDTPRRFGVDVEANYRHDDSVDSGDTLWTGDANFVYRFAQSPKVQMRSGLGVNWLSDSDDAEIGFNFTYGGDFQFAEPWILSLETDLGRIGQAGLVHARATLGVNYRNVELYTGYDYFRIGEESISSMLTGLRFWY